MGIILLHGRPIKRITIKIDDKGNSNIEAVDLRKFSRIPGQPEVPLPLSALEILYWLTKTASDALAQTINQIEKANGGAGIGVQKTEAGNEENKTD